MSQFDDSNDILDIVGKGYNHSSDLANYQQEQQSELSNKSNKFNIDSYQSNDYVPSNPEVRKNLKLDLLIKK